MEFSRPATWADALAIKAEQPAALAIARGTDVMVDINFDRVRPAALRPVAQRRPLELSR